MTAKRDRTDVRSLFVCFSFSDTAEAFVGHPRRPGLDGSAFEVGVEVVVDVEGRAVDRLAGDVAFVGGELEVPLPVLVVADVQFEGAELVTLQEVHLKADIFPVRHIAALAVRLVVGSHIQRRHPLGQVVCRSRTRKPTCPTPTSRRCTRRQPPKQISSTWNFPFPVYSFFRFRAERAEDIRRLFIPMYYFPTAAFCAAKLSSFFFSSAQ